MQGNVRSPHKVHPLTKLRQLLTCQIECLRVYIQAQQVTIGTARLQDAPGMSSSAKRAIYVQPSPVRLHRVYNFMVKNWLV